MHSLRIGRQCLVEEMDGHDTQSQTGSSIKMTQHLTDKVMQFDPQYNLLLQNNHDCSASSKKRIKAHDTFLRELASVHRSDLVLVCSPVEMKMLEEWGVAKSKLILASFFCEEEDCSNWKMKSSPTYKDRQDFVTVGGFKHPPNVDSVKVHSEIWPRIRTLLPDARMHIYGAYPTPQILSPNDEKSGFIVHGPVDDLDEKLSQARVLLAPLRYGAGIKGKIVDAWRNGCPVVTSPIGAEGCTAMTNINQYTSDTVERLGGIVVSDTEQFVDAAVKVYQQPDLWASCQEEGFHLLGTLFNGRDSLPVVEHAIHNAMENLQQRRQQDVFGSLLWHQSTRSTEYFSKWIELKESTREIR